MILAKSDGTTLQEHILDCLKIATFSKECLPEIYKDFDVYNLLIIAILFHDFGKLNSEFQNVLLNKTNEWDGQRHEIYSVIFSNKIQFSKDGKELVQKAILSHHKSFEELRKSHLTAEELNEDFEDYWKMKGYEYNPKDVLKNLCKFKKEDLGEISKFIFDYLNINKIDFLMLPFTYSVQKHPVEELAISHKFFNIDSVEYMKNLLFLGLLKMCDHYGSAKIDYIPNMKSSDLEFWNKSNEPFKHQIDCWNSNQNIILTAPTGSGKTECALGWLKLILKNSIGKAFYVLPYTASINAMHVRLCKNVEKCEPTQAKLIGIQHGKIEQYLEQYIDKDYKLLKGKSESFKNLIHPLKITTPFQILKYFYGVKAFEIGFANLYGAKIIFDEIHAYDVITFAQLIVIIDFLVRKFKVSIFIMTATLPTFQKREIEKVLPNYIEVNPTTEFMKNKIRHRVLLFEGNVFSAIEKLGDEISSVKQVIFVLNTVNQAQKCYEMIKNKFPNEKICLIHGRFTANDRMKNEKLAFEKDTKFLIGTQAIEVSLDIDYDLLITDPAPLDALLQRFGRVNRQGEKTISSIYVCRESSGNDGKIYPNEIVNKTLSVLSEIDILKEAEVQILIDKVYPDWLLEQKKEFEEIKNLFSSSLESLQPYSKNKEREEEFYEKFDGVKILPVVFYNDYKNFIWEGKFIKAESLFVNLHRSTYRYLKNKEDGSWIIKDWFSILKGDKTKTISVYLALCKYSSEMGLLLDEYQQLEFDNQL